MNVRAKAGGVCAFREVTRADVGTSQRLGEEHKIDKPLPIPGGKGPCTLHKHVYLTIG